MTCQGCVTELNIFCCDCYKYTTEKIYCYHIHIVALSEKKQVMPPLNDLTNKNYEMDISLDKRITFEKRPWKASQNSIEMFLKNATN